MSTLKIHPEDKQQLKTVKAFLKALEIPFEASEESPNDPGFVAKIKESEREADQGTVTSIKTQDLWK